MTSCKQSHEKWYRSRGMSKGQEDLGRGLLRAWHTSNLHVIFLRIIVVCTVQSGVSRLVALQEVDVANKHVEVFIQKN